MAHSRQFVEQVASGQSSDAKETIENALSAMAFEALETRKQEIASTMFGAPVAVEESIDVNTIKAAQKTAREKPLFNKDAESDRNIGKKYGSRQDAKSDDEELLTKEEFDNLSEEEQKMYLEYVEQLDEISLKKASQLYTGRWKKAFDPDQPQDHTDPYNDKALGKWEKTHNAISKKFGEKGLNRIARLNKTLSTKHPEPYGSGLKRD